MNGRQCSDCVAFPVEMWWASLTYFYLVFELVCLGTEGYKLK